MTEFLIETPYTSDQSSPMRWLLSHWKRHKLLISGTFIGAFGNAALAAAIPVLIGIAFNAALADPPDFRTISLAALPCP